ncbi:MAG: hypothetical protein H8D47_02900 [Planctomycetes bacterium]|nr:hypothetical protein [Planctomycetota bacterium]MBL7106051.1 hypothetical protein [Phycisphaerae bacterium]
MNQNILMMMGLRLIQTLSPNLTCVSCKKDGQLGEEEILCNLTRADQQGEEEFHCEAYGPKE